MPTYEYQCLECTDRFERFQKMTDPAVTECPSCGGGVRKLMHPPAIAFKGPGFYVNDYRKNGGPSGSAKTSTAPADEAAPPKAASEKTDEQKQEMKDLIGA